MFCAVDIILEQLLSLHYTLFYAYDKTDICNAFKMSLV